MTYRVIWLRKLVDRINEYAFLASELGRDDDDVSRAVGEIENRLGRDPVGAGESRGDGERVLIVPPLTVVFEVFDDQQAVVIYELVYHHGRS